MSELSGVESRIKSLFLDWEKPTLEQEMGEIERTAEELGVPEEALLEAFNRAVLEDLNDHDWSIMVNCDSRDATWKLEEVRTHLEGQRDFSQIEEGFKNNHKIPAPIVLFRFGHPPYLIGGNSRLLGCRALHIQPKILALRLENE